MLELLLLALKLQGSDIHFISKFDDVLLKVRTKGKLVDVETKPIDIKLMRFLQYAANMDLGRLSKPQSGVFERVVEEKLLSLRYSSITQNGRTDAVLRILNQDLDLDIDDLSRIQSQNDFFKSLFKNREGLVLFSGPTGSGKTTTLYTILKWVKEKKICSIEDPIEIIQDNMSQIQISYALGIDYDEAIKELLRQDPDIIMIGEIRDEEAAKAALKAANTGHIVLSSIHSATASSTISRMVELGVDENHLYESLLCLCNQRMMYTKETEDLVVLYEIMDEDEISYFRKHQQNSDAFLSIKKQIREGEKDGTFK